MASPPPATFPVPYGSLKPDNKGEATNSALSTFLYMSQLRCLVFSGTEYDPSVQVGRHEANGIMELLFINISTRACI